MNDRQSRSRRSFRLGLPGLLLLAGVAVGVTAPACSKLTSPPSPEPISTDTSVTGASAAKAPPPRPSATAPAAAAAPAPPIDPNAKLVSTDTVVGKGPAAKTGDTVSVHYVGTLTDGKEFDSSRKRNQPFVFTLGQGRVIKGWDQGVVGMKVGGKRKLVIPAVLAYGDRAMGPMIPAGSTLNFDIELVEIKK
jgi:FKBP-type peptidyl-prolyl cis-trans isomerase